MDETKSPSTVRRSVALPLRFLEELAAVTPPELKNNFNRLVHQALLEFIERQRRLEFEREMDEMGQDPEVVAESAALCRDFEPALADGLENL